ncbi:MAG: polysaccharide biosynthesis tyrosine autokinase [Rhodospirillaceae bacterium]|nr:polysaccharide biosynthesis tyrosine autokinase [Rhodospirillaceae bacterium]
MATVTRLTYPEADETREGQSSMPFAAPDDSLSIRRILGVLRRRAILIAGIAVLVTSIAAVWVSQLTPLYVAQAQLVVSPARTPDIGADPLTPTLAPDFWTNETEAAIIGSRELARKAVERLNLVNSPLYNASLRPPERGLVRSIVGPLKAFVSDMIVKPAKEFLFGAPDAATDPSPAQAAQTADNRQEMLVDSIVAAYVGGLSVVPQDRSRIITVQYRSTDPEMAALGANTAAEVYILDQLSVKGEASSRAGRWLSDRVNEMRRRVIESERRLEEFRREVGITDLGGATLYQQQLAGLSEELVLARGERAEAEARFDQIQDLLDQGGDLDTIAAVIDSRLIQNLREQEAGLAAKFAELGTQFRPNHPKMKLAETELNGLQGKIRGEVEKVLQNLGNELQIAKVRETNLQREVTRLEEMLDEQGEAEVTLRALESEVRANKQLYETLLARFKETNVQRDELLQQADARIISRATVPGGPYFPKKGVMIFAALVVSLIIGVAISLLTEFLDSGFRSLHQIEALTGLPAIGLVPAVSDLERQGKRPHEIALEKPNSTYGEAIRTLRKALLLSQVDHPPRTIIVTSSVPGEGKTSTALSLAATAARSAQKAIVIDCDLRNSTLHTYLDHPNHIGLGDYLAGLASLEDVIEIDPRSGVHFIAGGNRAPNPTDLLGSEDMRGLLRQLSRLYDLVVLDTPPILAVSDALVLVRHVDKTVFLVRWEKTRRESAMVGMKTVIEAGADLAGVLLTQVDVRKHAQYDYADSGYYYYGSYKNYYTE